MPTYECYKCDKKFNHKNNFRKHLNRKIPCTRKSTDENPLSCSECNKKYSTKGNLKRHKIKCCKEKVINNLDILNTNSNTNINSNIQTDSDTHINQKNKKLHECSYCNSIFSRSDSLKRHYSRCKEKKLFDSNLTMYEKKLIEKNKEISKIQISNENEILKMRINNENEISKIQINNESEINKYNTIIKKKDKIIRQLYNQIAQLNKIIETDREDEREDKIIDENTGCGEIMRIGNRFKCVTCDKVSHSLQVLEYHMKVNCDNNIIYNNVYKFGKDTLGKQKYLDEEDAGEIYIMRNDFHLNNFYKIGKTSKIRRRLVQYRTGMVKEPQLLYYFPCSNIHKADKILKRKLRKYNVKREMYKGDLEELKNIVTKNLKIVNSDSHALYFRPKVSKEICECEFCGKYFVTAEYLETHQAVCKTN